MLLVLGLVVGAALFGGGLVLVAVHSIRRRRALPGERYRGPSPVLLLVLALLVSIVAAVPFGAEAAALLGGEGRLSPLAALVLLTTTQIALIVISVVFVALPNALAGQPSLANRMPLRSVALGVGWGAVGWVVASAIGVVVVILLALVGIEPDPQAAEQALGVVDPVVAVVAIVLVAPIGEEIFFRGVVYSAWRREYGRTRAILGSATLFALIHFELVALVPIFVLGLALAWLYERTRSLLAVIVMHATFNGISVLLALLARFEVIRLPT